MLTHVDLIKKLLDYNCKASKYITSVLSALISFFYVAMQHRSAGGSATAGEA